MVLVLETTLYYRLNNRVEIWHRGKKRVSGAIYSLLI